MAFRCWSIVNSFCFRPEVLSEKNRNTTTVHATKPANKEDYILLGPCKLVSVLTQCVRTCTHTHTHFYTLICYSSNAPFPPQQCNVLGGNVALNPLYSFTVGHEAITSRWPPASWHCLRLTVPAWTTTAIIHGLTGLLYMRSAAFFLPGMWYTEQITFHYLPWSQSSAFSCSTSQREAWIIVWHGRCQHREICFCLTTEPYTGFLIYFQKVCRWSRYGKIWWKFDFTCSRGTERGRWVNVLQRRRSCRRNVDG